VSCQEMEAGATTWSRMDRYSRLRTAAASGVVIIVIRVPDAREIECTLVRPWSKITFESGLGSLIN